MTALEKAAMLADLGKQVGGIAGRPIKTLKGTLRLSVCVHARARARARGCVCVASSGFEGYSILEGPVIRLVHSITSPFPGPHFGPLRCPFFHPLPYSVSWQRQLYR